MACTVTYNENNEIKKVSKPNGKESTLFRKIASHPSIDTLEDSLAVYKNIYTDKMNQKEENYMVANRVDGVVYGSYKKALENNPAKIEVGFLDNSGNFTPFKTIEPSFDPKTEKGFINLNIKEGFISEVKEIYDGKSYFQAGGSTHIGKSLKDDLLRERASIYLGWKKFKRTVNGFLFGEHLDLEKPNEVNSILENEVKKALRQKTNSEVNTGLLTEKELKLRLLDLLNVMGVTVTSITDYVDKYNVKNGVDPSAKALADIANKVIAVKDGEISFEELTEETAHFIVEAWEQKDIENLLRNINKTEEYQQFAESYRELYSKKYEGEELEQAVRREVLGKVLSNSLRNGFETETKQGIVKNIINKIKQLFDKFLEAVGINTTEQARKDLNSFTEQVNERLAENTLQQQLNFGNFENNKFVLYSANQQSGKLKGMKVEIEQALKTLRSSINKLPLKDASGSLKAKRALQKLQDLGQKESKELQKQAALDIVSVAESQINYLKNLIKDTKNNESITFGANETAAYQTLIHNLDPIITSIKSNIKNRPEDYKGWNKVSEELERVQRGIGNLKEDIKDVHDGTIDKLVDQAIAKNPQLGEEYREHVKEWLQAAQKDTMMFHRYFGQITNSQDPLLGLLSQVAEDTMLGARQEYTNGIKPFLKNLMDVVGIRPQDLKSLFDKGYLVNPIDYARVKQTEKRIKAEVRKEVTGETDSVEDIMKKAKEDKLETLTPEQSKKYGKLLQERLGEIRERFFNDRYYNELKEKHNRLGISEPTKDTISSYSATRAQLIQKITSKDNILDWSKLQKADYEALKNLKKERKVAKDFFKTDGNLKANLESSLYKSEVPSEYFTNDGLKQTAPVFQTEDGFYYFIQPNKVNDLESQDAKIAIDLNKLDKEYAENASEKEANYDLFFRKLSEVENEDSAMRFLETNASLMLSKNFWDSLSKEKSFIDEIEDAIENESKAVKESFEALKQNIAKRRALLSRHKDPNKPFEIEKIYTADIQNKILELDEEISSGYSKLSSFVEKDAEQEEVERNFEVSVNQAYKNQVEEFQYSLKEEINFIQKNSTNKANDRISNFRYNLEANPNGLTNRQKQFIEDGGYDLTEVDLIIRDFAKTQIGSYYKKLAPEGVDSLLEKKEDESVVEYAKRINADPNIDFIPNFSFLEDTQQKYKNPNFDPNFEGRTQVKKGDIKRTVPLFNEDGSVQKDEQGNTKITTEDLNFESEKYKNEIENDDKKLQALNALLNLHRKTLENYGITGQHDLYLAPQITKKGVDRVKDTVKRATSGGIKQGMKELFTYRVDDLEYGQSVGAEETPVIPTYYTTEIENQEELTDELFYSYAAMYQQSVLHKHRKNNIGDALALKESIESRQEAGLGANTKNTVEMMDDYFKYAFFGIQESQSLNVRLLGRTLDVAKLARNFLNYIKFRNLGLSTVVGATSYLTSEVSFQIEKYVGEILNKESTALGAKEWRKLAKESIGETGKIRSKSKMNILGEFFGIFQTEERFNNSNYSYFSRNILNPSKIGMSVHQMGNFPITPKAMLAVLHDHRVTKTGEILNYNNFINQQKELGTPKDKIKAEWRELESQTLYNFLDVSEDGGVKINESIYNKLKPDFQNKDYLDSKMQNVTRAVKRAASQLDTQITTEQRVAAQRHFALNYFMTHKGWLSVKISNRTKNSHYNLATGEYEQGSYRTFGSFVANGLYEMAKNKNIKAFTDLWNGKDLKPEKGVSVEAQLKVRRRNMRRVGLDTAFIAGLSGLSYLLLQAADDDEDNWAKQFSSYLTLRVLNEQVSGSMGLPRQLYETLESPFVGLNVVGNVISLPYNLAAGNKEVESGRYKGMTERQRNLIKVAPAAKTIFDMNNVKDARDSYYFYNSTNLKFNPTSAMMVIGLDD